MSKQKVGKPCKPPIPLQKGWIRSCCSPAVGKQRGWDILLWICWADACFHHHLFSSFSLLSSSSSILPAYCSQAVPCMSWVAMRMSFCCFTTVHFYHCSHRWLSAIPVSPIFSKLSDCRTLLLSPFNAEWENNEEQRDEVTLLSPIPVLTTFTL